MKILALDSTGPNCSAALIEGERVVASVIDPIGHGHAEHIGAQVQSLLAGAQCSVKDLGRIAVCSGPGSFAGLRVALSFAKGLALPHAIPVLGISALQVWAAMADPEKVQRVFAVHDARRGELFGQIFERGIARGQARLYSLDTAVAATKSCDQIIGSGAPKLDRQHAAQVSPAVLAFLAAGVDPKAFLPLPLYQRPPDAKLPSKLRKRHK